MQKLLIRALFLTGLILVVSPAHSRAAQEPAPTAQKETETGQKPVEPQVHVEKGVRVEFSVEPAPDRQDDSPALREGDFAEIRFQVTDAETGAPVSPLEPAVWISGVQGLEADMSCRDRIGKYLQGMLSFQADVDLNKYFILIMNNDQTISVVDPLLGVSGITQLYAMIVLEEPGEDWTRSSDEKKLFVTLPKAGKVAVVDLENFKVMANVDAGRNPVRVALQPDGKYLWVGNDGKEEGESGVTVIDARSFTVAGYVPTGAGHHEIAFSSDSLSALVTNSLGGTVSVVDTQRLAKVKDLSVDKPVSVQFSSLSQAAYLAGFDGSIDVVDVDRWEISRQIQTETGLVNFRLDPAGRWGFAANVERDRVDIVDVSLNSIAHTLAVESKPHQFAFTDTYAYVRHLGTAEVTLIPLAQLAGQAQPGIQKVALGSKAPGDYTDPTVADSISPTGEWTAVVAANPADRMVYYYMEGMIAPMGSYTTYGRVPRAVGVVDRSVRETEKGVYAAKFRVPKSGDFDVALIIDSPFIGHCFSFSAEPDAGLAVQAKAGQLELQFLNEKREVSPGQAFPLRFALIRSLSREPVADLNDVVVLATRPPGNWQERRRAKSIGDGTYAVSIPADQAGVYYVSVAVPSLNLDFTELPYMSFFSRADKKMAEKR